MVNKTTNISGDDFKANLITGLTAAYTLAFQRAFTVFINQKSRNYKSIGLNNQVLVVPVNITNTGKTNALNTKYMVNVVYYVQNNNALVKADFAATSINLLSGQEMAQFLNQEVVNQGYAQSVPIVATPVVDNRLWIIGAVIGAIVFVIVLFWIVACFYYTCINPKKNLKTPRARRLTESPSSVSKEND